VLMARKPKPEPEDRISLKGTKEGLVVTVGEGELLPLMNELARHLQHKAPFFGGAQAILDTGPRELTTEDVGRIRELFSANRMEICAIRTTVQETAQAAGALHIPVVAGSTEDPSLLTSEIQSDHEPREALFVKRTIRSGQNVQYPGHVTIVGDVNPGAEVVASGDIIIWGKLRGTVHAGAQGDDTAMVCALLLEPTQLRIGNHIARSPEGGERDSNIPEIAQVDKRGIVVKPWNMIKQ